MQVEDSLKKLEGTHSRSMKAYNPERLKIPEWRARRNAEVEGQREAQELTLVLKVCKAYYALFKYAKVSHESEVAQTSNPWHFAPLPT